MARALSKPGEANSPYVCFHIPHNQRKGFDEQILELMQLTNRNRNQVLRSLIFTCLDSLKGCSISELRKKQSLTFNL